MIRPLPLALLALLPALPAYALNLSGTWQGPGQALDARGRQIPCENVAITFTHDAGSLGLNYAFTCDGDASSIPGSTLELRGSELFEQGEKVGTLGDGSLDLVTRAKGFVMRMQASFSDSAMTLHSLISVGRNPKPVFTFDATLKR